MHADLCGNERATSTRGVQVETALDFAAIRSPHDGCYFLDVDVGRQVFNFKIGLQ